MLKRTAITRNVSNNSITGPIWNALRDQRILFQQARVARFWRGKINLYVSNLLEVPKIAPRKRLQTDKIIWQYWGQGLDEDLLPEVVKICFSSVDQFKGEYQVIRLTDETVKDYIELPEFIWHKRQESSFLPVFFSDLLRMALLQQYGGVWLDATILLTGELPQFSEYSYFAYQRDSKASHKTDWKTLNRYYWGWNEKFRVNVMSSVWYAKRGDAIVAAMLNLLLHYWQTQDKITNYFFLQILYNELVKGHLKAEKCEVIDDTLPHLLMGKMYGLLEATDFNYIFEKQNLHKLTYFNAEKLEYLNEIMGTYAPNAAP